MLVGQITQPDKYFIMGGTYRVPVAMHLLDKNFVRDLKLDGTFNDSSFEREYESCWSGTIEDAYFNGDAFDRNRVLLQPEYEYSARSSKNAYYILAVDVGRKGCDTVVCVFKVTPQSTGALLKTLVNIYTLHDEHFEDQAIALKQLYYRYKARRLVIDANGLGIGLIDFMVKTQINLETNDVFPKINWDFVK